MAKSWEDSIILLTKVTALPIIQVRYLPNFVVGAQNSGVGELLYIGKNLPRMAINMKYGKRYAGFWQQKSYFRLSWRNICSQTHVKE